MLQGATPVPLLTLPGFEPGLDVPLENAQRGTKLLNLLRQNDAKTGQGVPISSSLMLVRDPNS